MANKQGSNKEANVRTYYSEVNKFNQNGEYDKAIKSLNKSKFLMFLRVKTFEIDYITNTDSPPFAHSFKRTARRCNCIA